MIMKEKFVKFLEFVAVIIALIIAVLVGRDFGVESILRGKEEPVTLAMTEELLISDCIGMPAADDIPRIENIQAWDDTYLNLMTIEPTAIMPTGIGVRNTWVSAYSTSRRGRVKSRPSVSDTAFDFFGDYGEYYIIKLPDESYILAQMPRDYALKLEAGKKVTLPIGHKISGSSEALHKIEDLCEEYNVFTDGIFYCINDKWNESHSFLVMLIRFGLGALVALVLGTILIMIVDKIFKVKD